MIFDRECRLCPRLAGFLDQVKTEYPTYHARPVPPFGDDAPKLLIIGLAPGMHGANRTGRPFTGDYAGILLYDTLHRYGFATAATSVAADDGLQLIGCRISNAVKCLPPENKPTGDEITTCNRYLAAELATLPASTVLLALGNVAHLAVMKALQLRPTAYKFGHAARHVLPTGHVLYDSYHCSRYNTQTRRLTDAMFHQVFEHIRNELRRT
ncbi:MAG TPA: uracil-DNA glycosylase [Methylophilaceae bacterium]|nr:uracil-DNA glycosylase [Methylophilaceae bacterium]